MSSAVAEPAPQTENGLSPLTKTQGANAPRSSGLKLNSPELIRRVNELRKLDNVTNWFYLVREWLFMGLAIGLTIAFYQGREEWGLAWAWNVPVTILAVIIIGACQHRLTNLAHEASHYMLFRNRLLNEFASDWFCLFPMLSSTHHYRLQHLAHHQFANDPERDPDISQMTESGHYFEYPMTPGQFVWHAVVKQLLWVPALIRYTRVRAKYNATGAGKGPYRSKKPRSRMVFVVGGLYLVSLIGTLTALVMLDQLVLLGLVPAAMLAAVLTFYYKVPDDYYTQSVVKPDISMRYMTFLRLTFLTLLFSTFAWLTVLTGYWWAVYYFVLWVVPLFTTFSFFMILRQIVQHGNAPRDRLTNTRIFHVNPLIHFAVFPLGMDYHLPHHLFPMVPHYRIRKLHSLLMEADEYRQEAVIVEGYFLPRERPPVNPTVIDLMGRQL